MPWKHSRPSRIEVSIEELPASGLLVARVKDDGGGFDANNASGDSVIGMKEHAVGGTLTVENRHDGPGVVVTATAAAGRRRGENSLKGLPRNEDSCDRRIVRVCAGCSAPFPAPSHRGRDPRGGSVEAARR